MELVERCVLALTDQGDCILDPFVGTGSSIVAALKHKRKAVGIEKDAAYVRLARGRVEQLNLGSLKLRPLGRPVARPNPSQRVAQVPAEWKSKLADR